MIHTVYIAGVIMFSFAYNNLKCTKIRNSFLSMSVEVFFFNLLSQTICANIEFEIS